MSPLTLFTMIGLGWGALMGMAPKVKVSAVAATFAVAPDSTVSATMRVTVRGTLKPGDQIRYKIVKDTDTVFNTVRPPFSLSITGLPAPAYGMTAVYKPCARVVYVAGTQSPEVCGTGWSYTRPDLPPAEIDSVILVTPEQAMIGPGGSQQFSATVVTSSR